MSGKNVGEQSLNDIRSGGLGQVLIRCICEWIDQSLALDIMAEFITAAADKGNSLSDSIVQTEVPDMITELKLANSFISFQHEVIVESRGCSAYCSNKTLSLRQMLCIRNVNGRKNTARCQPGSAMPSATTAPVVCLAIPAAVGCLLVHLQQ